MADANRLMSRRMRSSDTWVSSTYKMPVFFEGLDHVSLGLVSRALPEVVLLEPAKS